MKTLGKVLAGFVVGFLVGILGVVTHAGPLDRPFIGLILSFLLLASGSWFMLASGWNQTWLGALIGASSATIWLLMYPPANDSFISVQQWASQAWLLLAPAAILFPAVMQGRKGRADD